MEKIKLDKFSAVILKNTNTILGGSNGELPPSKAGLPTWEVKRTSESGCSSCTDTKECPDVLT